MELFNRKFMNTSTLGCAFHFYFIKTIIEIKLITGSTMPCANEVTVGRLIVLLPIIQPTILEWFL